MLSIKSLQSFLDEFAYSRWVTYNRLRAFSIDLDAKVTTETRRQADNIYDGLGITGYKLEEKKQFFQYLLHAAKVAKYHDGCIMYTRDMANKSFSKARLQVIDAAVRDRFFLDRKSLKGSPKSSRLIPTEKLVDATKLDPWQFDPDQTKYYVLLRDRSERKEKKFSKKLAIPAEYQQKLELINEVNRSVQITHRVWCPLSQEYMGKRILSPVHYALFTDDFDSHGRIYTGRYGHQGLLKVERATLRLGNSPTAEKDYSGLHTRMLYHLEGISYRDDPYDLWDNTTPHMRLLAKIFINSLINAKTPKAAMSACNRALCTKTKEGDRKSGKSLRDSQRLRDAYNVTGLKFKDLLPIVQRHHYRIAHRFGQDMGIKLMRIDGGIALDVMHHFAKQWIPCLGCHDSFIVPHRNEEELVRVMGMAYYQRLGHAPVIK